MREAVNCYLLCRMFSCGTGVDLSIERVFDIPFSLMVIAWLFTSMTVNGPLSEIVACYIALKSSFLPQLM